MRITRNTAIEYDGDSRVVAKGVAILRRDMDRVLGPADPSAAPDGAIRLVRRDGLPAEQYVIREGVVEAGDDLGFMYALLHISEQALGVPPLWFWLDHRFEPKDSAQLEDCRSTPAAVKLRGWFINDEILLNEWTPKPGDPLAAWDMACEALLRLGGNLIIPTTQIKRPQQHLAAGYGLKLTHHHAEPLGADMFSKRFPDLTPSYKEHPDLYEQLWREAIHEQSDADVIWTLGFRGQGDRAFWEDDPEYDTDAKRGALIGKIMRRQVEILREEVTDPQYCVYVYGEVMDLVKQGHLILPENAIKVYSDNGYGKMVSRRTGEHNARIPSVPHLAYLGERNGIYYHVSYCDLHTCSHLTPIANSVSFLRGELQQVLDAGATDYWIVNCSNIRPHVFALAMVADAWNGVAWDGGEEFAARFGREYFADPGAGRAFLDWADAAVQFGPYEDEHAGDHFTNFMPRAIATALMRGDETMRYTYCEPGVRPVADWIDWYAGKAAEGARNYEAFLDTHTRDFGSTHRATILLAGRMHLLGYRGGALFMRACREFLDGHYYRAFYDTGLAAECFAQAHQEMRDSERGVWKGYWANDAFADYQFTAYLLRRFMTVIRAHGEGWGYWDWQRELFYAEEDKGVHLQLNLWSRQSDEECFECMKELTAAGHALPEC